MLPLAHWEHVLSSRYHEGVCSCHSTPRRDLAEQMILEEITNQIVADAALRQAVLEAARRYWDEERQTLPTELESAEIALADAEKVVSRLMDLWSIVRGMISIDLRDPCAT